MRKIRYVGCFVSLFLVACSTQKTEKKNEKNITAVVKDVHSFANLSKAKTKHLHLDLKIDFDSKTINGVARHQLNTFLADTVIFDIKELEIEKVTIGKEEHEKETDFFIGKNDTILGQPLTVLLSDTSSQINIYYSTTDKTEALDWLPAELTSGKKHPFLYTQGQAILTRSWIPLQDTPSNRITYSANLRVPQELMAIMSASNPTEKSEDGSYHFEMKQAIPSYLIALAVGDLTYTKLSPNCGVYSEKELATQCAYEFADLPKMISMAEKLYGKYQWEQFDMVVLPYSFPFGGMENPRLTFANPTLLAGDRSLVTTIAHELAHSWSGNLVTNATWNDFWLNEGFTVYFENRIMEALYGKELADMLMLINKQDLDMALDDFEEIPEDTHLKLELENRNPDDGMTDIAYNKGAYFLLTIEATVGREKFDKFLNDYFEKYAFQTITTEDFVRYLNRKLLKPNNVDFNIDEWIYQSGIPENCIEITSDRLGKMTEMADQMNAGEFNFDDFTTKRSDFATQEWVTFIRNLSTEITPKTMAKIDSQLKFSEEGNDVLKSEWFLLAAKSGNKELRPAIKKHLVKVGRRWLVENIYRALANSKNPNDLVWAKEVFEEAKNGYHFVTKSTVEGILNQ